MSGTSDGYAKNHIRFYSQPSLFRRLAEAGRSWRVYRGGVLAFVYLFADMNTSEAVQHVWPMSQFEKDAAADPADFPEFSLVEPKYSENDDHPPHDLRAGQKLIARVYNALRANAQLWQSTLLIVTYDEHGGFYDHVRPPKATPPDAQHQEYTFDRYGVRVPSLLVSPWIKPQVVNTELDHTSLLRYLQVKWKLGSMGRRVSKARSVLTDVGLAQQPRVDTRRLPVPRGAQRVRTSRELTDVQRGLIELADLLYARLPPSARRLERMAVSATPQLRWKRAEAKVLEYEKHLRAHKTGVPSAPSAKPPGRAPSPRRRSRSQRPASGLRGERPRQKARRASKRRGT